MNTKLYVLAVASLALAMSGCSVTSDEPSAPELIDGLPVSKSSELLEPLTFAEPDPVSSLESESLRVTTPQYVDGGYSLTIGSIQQETTENGAVSVRIPMKYNLPVECSVKTDEELCHNLAFSFYSENEGHWDLQTGSVDEYYPFMPSESTPSSEGDTSASGATKVTVSVVYPNTAIETEVLGTDRAEATLRVVHPEYEETTVVNVLTGEKISSERVDR